MKTDKRNFSLNCAKPLLCAGCVGALATGAAPSFAQTSSSVHLTPSFTSSWHAADGALWQNAQLKSPLSFEQDQAMTRSQMQQSLRTSIAADPLLNELNQFRQTLRGSGKMAVRKWSLAGSGKNAINLELGKHTLPGLSLAGLNGSQASVGIGGQKFGFYSSVPVHSLNEALASYDQTLGQKNKAVVDATKMTWLQIQPIESKTANLQLVWASGQRDLKASSTDNEFLQGSLWGVEGKYAIPFLTKWNFSGQWVKSNVGESHGATAWQAKLGGPIQHPLGTAKLEAVYTNVAPGFESFAGDSLEDGRITKTLALTQPLGKGDLTAKLGLSWNQIERTGYNHRDLPRTDSTFNSIVSMRWQLASGIALTAKHTLTKNTDELYPGSSLRMKDQVLQDTQAGLELTVAPSLVFNVGAGMKSNEVQQQYLDAGASLLTDQDSNYLTVGVKNKRKRGSIGVDMQRSFSQDDIADNADSDVIVNLNAQQKLSKWLSVGGKLKLTDNYDPRTVDQLLKDPADWTANAQISLKSLGAVQLSFSQWNLQNALDSKDADDLNAYQISYLLGARNGQSGLGFSLAYSYSAAENPQNSMWKVGLTYR